MPVDESNDPPPTTVFVRWDAHGERTLTITGDLDLAVKTELQLELGRLVAEAHSPACVDLSGVTFMDSTGLNALCGAENAGRAVGVPIVLVGASAPVRRLLELTGLWDHFERRIGDDDGI